MSLPVIPEDVLSDLIRQFKLKPEEDQFSAAPIRAVADTSHRKGPAPPAEPTQKIGTTFGYGRAPTTPAAATAKEAIDPTAAPMTSGRIAGDNTDSRSIFCAGLEMSVDDHALLKFFEPFGTILSVRILRSPQTGESRCSGYVNFLERHSAEEAARTYHHKFTSIGKSLTVRVADRDVSHVQEPVRKIFLRNIPPGTTREALLNHCTQYGLVHECHIHEDISRKGREEKTRHLMGYVAFDTVQQATYALSRMKGAKPFPNHEEKTLEVKLAETLGNRNERVNRKI